MNGSTSLPQIPDETLSAYLDGAVSAEERHQIESALRTDHDLAWRLESLRQTVLLLRALPAVQMPRTFTLESILATEGAMQGTTVQGADATGSALAPRVLVPAPQPSLLERLGAFFNSGSLALRNGAMVAAALFVVVLAGGSALESERNEGVAPMTASAPAVMESVALLESAPADSARIDPAADLPAAETQQEAPAAAQDVVPAAESAAEEVSANVASDAAQSAAMPAATADPFPAEAEAAVAAAAMGESPAATSDEISSAGALAEESPAAAPHPEMGGGGGVPDHGAGGPLPPAMAAPADALRPPGPDSTGLDSVLGDSQGMAPMPAPASARITDEITGSAEAEVAASVVDAEVGESVTAEEAADVPVSGSTGAAESVASEATEVFGYGATADADVSVDSGASTDAVTESSTAREDSAATVSATASPAEPTEKREAVALAPAASDAHASGAQENTFAQNAAQESLALEAGSASANGAVVNLAANTPVAIGWLLPVTALLGVATLVLALLWLRSRRLQP